MDKIIKEYIDKYCKYCANRDEDDMCNIVRDIDGNAKCENYKTYYSMDISDLLLKIGRQEGKIEYLEQENAELKKINKARRINLEAQQDLIGKYKKMLDTNNELYVRKSVIREKIEKISKIKTITDSQKSAINYATIILQNLLESEEEI